jgi:hypothetical protein
MNLENGSLLGQLGIFHSQEDFNAISRDVQSDSFVGIFKVIRNETKETLYWTDLSMLTQSEYLNVVNADEYVGLISNGSISLVDYSFKSNSFICSVPKGIFKICSKLDKENWR